MKHQALGAARKAERGHDVHRIDASQLPKAVADEMIGLVQAYLEGMDRPEGGKHSSSHSAHRSDTVGIGSKRKCRVSVAAARALPSLPPSPSSTFMRSAPSGRAPPSPPPSPPGSSRSSSPVGLRLGDATDYTEGELAMALRSYEAFHRIPVGSATVEQLQSSSAKIDGWLRFAESSAVK